jgi:N-methylhydantoinase B
MPALRRRGSQLDSKDLTPDAVTLAVLQGRLEQIADEMDATLHRSAFNPIIAEARDACHGLYDAETGETLVQGTRGLPIFVGAMAFAVRAVIAKVRDEGGLEPGDTFAFNDPYAGGTHLNDMRLVRPVFRQGRLFCWLASAGHWLDVGGNVPGNYNPRATETLQEGFRLPVVKLIRAGSMDRDLLAVMQANTRTPDSNWGDLNGQLNALDLGERRLHALLDADGEAVVRAAFDALARRAATLMEERIAALPDGAYGFEDFLDNDGIEDAPIRLALTLHVRGAELTLDFAGSAPACQGPLNISRATTIACCYVALKHAFPEVPANAGVLRPVNFVIPEGSILDAPPPRPMAGYTETILRVIGLVFGALAKADPPRATAAPFGTINALSLSGARADGSRFVMFSFFGGGLGGHPLGDGLHHANNPISMATMPPVEILEASYPVMFTDWALRPDSGGDGQHRGGVGAIYGIETLAPGRTEVALLGERGRFAPFGVNGGGPGATNRFAWTDETGTHEPPMASKVVGVSLPTGGRVRLETPGGGGWGDPAARDPEARARDVRRGFVSVCPADSRLQAPPSGDRGGDAP